MRHPLLTALLAVPLSVCLRAQCLDATGGASAGLVPTTIYPANDEGLSPPLAIGFPFPLAGSTWTHVSVDSNGVLYLTTGGVPSGRVQYGANNLTDVRGNAGDSPRVFPLWTDLEGGPGWAVHVDTAVPGQCRVIWTHVREFFGIGGFNVSATLFPGGEVEFAYGALPALPHYNTYAAVGISAGNAVGTGSETSSNLTTQPDSGTLPLLFETFDGAVPNVSLSRVLLLPNGLGGYTSVVTCAPGAHLPHGAGCYGDSVYELLADAPAAAAELQGNRLSLTPTLDGYAAAFVAGGASSFVAPPPGANVLPRSDDGQFALDLTANGLGALPTPTGPASVLYVHSNGFVSLGANNLGGSWNPPSLSDSVPSARCLSAPDTAFWAWHDWDPSDLTGGAIVWHHDVATNTLHVTWNGVENKSDPVVANPGTFQFQFHLATGAVDYVWVAVDGNASSPNGSAHLVGYSPGGFSADPGSIPFAAVGGTTTIATRSALTLSALPVPQLAPSGSSLPMSYTISNLPDFAPPATVRLGMLVFSVAGVPGIDLGFLGAAGCQLYIGSLDVQLPLAAVGSSTQAMTLTFPPPLAVGLSFHSQAFALFPANGLSGLNDFGLLSSNGLETRF